MYLYLWLIILLFSVYYFLRLFLLKQSCGSLGHWELLQFFRSQENVSDLINTNLYPSFTSNYELTNNLTYCVMSTWMYYASHMCLSNIVGLICFCDIWNSFNIVKINVYYWIMVAFIGKTNYFKSTRYTM